MEIEFNDENFETEVIKNEKPVLVDFWAPWCGPCQTMGPIIQAVAKKVSDTAKVGKLNVDENQKTATEFNIMSIPTIAIFQDGKIVKQMVGVQSEESLTEELKNLK